MPFAVVGANAMVEVKGKKIRGRQYPWGIVEVENPSHCDFVKLRTMLITHMQDLQVILINSLRHWCYIGAPSFSFKVDKSSLKMPNSINLASF